ncbi:glycosyltransferase family 39 protein [Hydrococcus rivularis]|nr:glycosyltransferase family 39 protein [Hydrococcus rivularis]
MLQLASRESRDRPLKQADMKTVIKISLIALLWIIAVSPGTIYGDTLIRLEMAHAWRTGREEVTLTPDNKPKSRLDSPGVSGVGGKRYTTYDAGQSLLMLPGDWLGSQLHRLLSQQDENFLRRLVVSFLIFIPLNLAAVLTCFWLLRLFDFNERIAGLASLTWLLSTTVLTYVQNPQQNNQILLFVTIGYAAALACVRHGKLHFAFLSGLALGAVILIRSSSIIHVLTVFLFLVGCLVYQNREKLKSMQAAGLWIIGLLPLSMLGRVIDYLRFGSFWTTGQNLWAKQVKTDPIFAGLPPLPADYPFINPPQFGIWGVLFSPAKSIFIYDPLLLPCLLLGAFLWKKLSPYMQWYLLCGIFNLALHIALTSKLDFWHGDAAWGARYHVTSVHLLLIPLIALLIERLLSVKGLSRWLIQSLLVLAIMMQMTSVVLRPVAEGNQIYFANPQSFLEFRWGERITNIGCLIDRSFSPECPSKLNSNLSNKLSLLPFNFTRGRNFIFIVWGLILIVAIASTVRFCFQG